MNRRRFVVALALLTGGASRGAALGARKPAAHTVVVAGMRYEPARLTIRAGDSITWVNKDIVDHTVTATAPEKPAFDSQTIAVGKSWTNTFPGAGAHDYRCTLHPTMKGSIEVLECPR